MAIQQFNISELDFDKIKDEIKAYYKRSEGPFKDFDYEGSGLNVILDILAHNTHYNAVLAHLAANETFISSAQLRKNVVARAKSLGYTPKSTSAAAAVLTLSNTSVTTIPEGTVFTSTDTLNNKKYNFVTFEEISDISSFTVYEGSIKNKQFTFDNTVPNLKFEIPDDKVDRTKIKVTVFDSIGSTQTELYTQFSELPGIDGESPVYFISENPNGRFEISFGDGVLGKKPLAGSVINIKYLATDGATANGLSVFSSSDSLFDNIGVPAITSAGGSSGGGAKEQIDSIRANAPLQFVSQNRAVTVDDYKTLVRANSNASVVSVWGGEDNDPPEFGKVLISAKPTVGETLTQDEKDRLLPILNSKGILTVRPKIIDPEYTNIYFSIFAQYNPAVTNLSAGGVSSLIKTNLPTFSEANLETFEGLFRYSSFLTYLSNLDPSILSVYARVFCYKNLSVAVSDTTGYKLDFNLELETPQDPLKSSISSTFYTNNGVRYSFKDEPSAIDNIRNIYRYYVNANGLEIVDTRNVGTVNSLTGVIEIDSFDTDADTTISFYSRPNSNDLVPTRNQILQIDSAKSTVLSNIDTVAAKGSSGAGDYITTPREQ
tara:strand:- start:1082 stop:2887 length:1806 start_codon:yes stop_codon:yes gene_type:complete